MTHFHGNFLCDTADWTVLPFDEADAVSWVSILLESSVGSWS